MRCHTCVPQTCYWTLHKKRYMNWRLSLDCRRRHWQLNQAHCQPVSLHTTFSPQQQKYSHNIKLIQNNKSLLIIDDLKFCLQMQVHNAAIWHNKTAHKIHYISAIAITSASPSADILTAVLNSWKYNRNWHVSTEWNAVVKLLTRNTKASNNDTDDYVMSSAFWRDLQRPSVSAVLYCCNLTMTELSEPSWTRGSLAETTTFCAKFSTFHLITYHRAMLI